MLDKVIMLPASMFAIFLVAFFALTGMGMFTQWSMVQNEAQFVAASMGKWGGYTEEAEESVREFANELSLSRRRVEVEVNNIGPVPWGRPISATISIPYRFVVGKYNVGTFTLTGKGRAVSTCLDAYAVDYISP